MRSIASALVALLVASSAAVSGQVPTPNPQYASMAPAVKYLMSNAAAEMAMARTAAPPSISDHATVLVLTRTGYVVGSKGTNGWVCWVDRAWTSGFDDPEFWNWRNRSAQCTNPLSVRTVLPQFLARAKWALEGDTREQMAQKAEAAYASHQFTDPAPGAFSFMLSKESYINDEVKGPWRPHVMFFIAQDQMATYAAGFVGSPILGPPPGSFRAYEPTTIAIPVSRWSDGSPAPK